MIAAQHYRCFLVMLLTIVVSAGAGTFDGINQGRDSSAVDSLPVADRGRGDSLREVVDTLPPLPGQNVTSPIEMDAPRVVFYTGGGKRTIEVASREGPWPELDSADYAYLIFAPVPGNDVFDEILRLGSIRRLSVHFSRREGHTHEVWVANLLGQDINDVRDRLMENFPTLFFNMAPYTYEDRLTPKTMGHVEFAAEERDEETGKILIQVRFFSDVPAERQEEILRSHFSPDELSIFGVDGVIRTHLEKISDVARFSEVQYISEYMRPLPTHIRPRPALKLRHSPTILDRDLRGRRIMQEDLPTPTR